MIRQLLDRRVPQFVGLYLVGSWGFLEFLDWAVSRYFLSPALIDFTVALLLLFLPTVVVIAWRHGAPGPDAWKTIDGMVFGLNALAGAVVLFMLFHGAELGRAATVKLVEDAEGNTVERVVPKASFRRSVLVYDFENDTGAADNDWLEYGMSLALVMDLAQDLFVSATTVDEPAIREWLAEHGVEQDDEVPLALKREGADLRAVKYFLSGTIGSGPDSLRVRTNLYDTGTGRVVASHDYGMKDPRDLADRMSVDLRRDLGIPEGQIEQSVDLPAGELLTDDPEAFRLTAEAQRKLLRGNDPAAAKQLAEEALAIDPTAAGAHIVLANASLFGGNQAAAGAAVADAIRYDYRLPERFRLAVQVQNEYLFKGDRDAAIRAGRYWTEVYPQDIEARRMLAAIYQGAGDTENQIRQLRALLSLDSTDVAAMRSLAAAFAQETEYDSAISYYEALRDRRSGDLDIRLELAQTQQAALRFDAARETLRDAAVVAPRDPDVPRELARLDLRTGDMQAAEQRLGEVEELERTPSEKERRLGLEESIYYQRGQFERLEDAYRRRLAALSEMNPTLGVVSSIDNSEYLLHAAEAGRGADALAQIDSLRSLVEEPWSLTLDFPAVRTHLAMGDVEAARESLAGIRKYIEFAGSAESRLSFISWVEGGIARLEDGDCRRALEFYDRAVEQNDRNALARYDRLDCLTRLERWSAAQADADWMLEGYPGRPIYRLAVARYYAARGRNDEALAHLDFALETWADADAAYRPAQEARALRESLRGA
jgi:tetratricopeptide (TPR) repeat protein/TolB-like protein